TSPAAGRGRTGFWTHRSREPRHAPRLSSPDGADRKDARDMEQFAHTPVLLDRCVELVGVGIAAAREAGITPYAVDGTLGMGGHTEGILEAHPDARVIGLDRDTEALERAQERLRRFGDRFIAVHAVDDELDAVLDELGIATISSLLLDLGVSSLQL